jgi:hypothetical protein
MEKVPEREAKIMKRRLRARDLTDITHTPLRPSGPSKKKEGGGGNKYTKSNAVTIRPSQAIGANLRKDPEINYPVYRTLLPVTCRTPQSITPTPGVEPMTY